MMANILVETFLNYTGLVSQSGFCLDDLNLLLVACNLPSFGKRPHANEKKKTSK